MTSERCAFLSFVAIAHKLEEAWICFFPVLPLMYISQYLPTIGKRFVDHRQRHPYFGTTLGVLSIFLKTFVIIGRILREFNVGLISIWDNRGWQFLHIFESWNILKKRTFQFFSWIQHMLSIIQKLKQKSWDENSMIFTLCVCQFFPSNQITRNETEILNSNFSSWN